jgi:ABC-type branched-subunit amino acid transport system ATPase component
VSEAQSPLLAAEGVTVRFGGLTAVDSVDFDVGPGEMVGIVGANGAGKSTLFSVLSGFLRSASGQFRMDGEDMGRRGPQQRARRGIARTFQQAQLFPELSVREHLLLAHRIRSERYSFGRDLLGFGRRRSVARHAERRIVDGLLAQLGLDDVADLAARSLPLSTARLVEVGRALATRPRILLLDEPTSGLHASESEALAAVLRRANENAELAMVIIEHDLDFVLDLVDRVVVLDFGRTIATGSPAEVRADPAVAAAYLGEALPDEVKP